MGGGRRCSCAEKVWRVGEGVVNGNGDMAKDVAGLAVVDACRLGCHCSESCSSPGGRSACGRHEGWAGRLWPC